jgi:predicted nucleic-acid-binding protein
MRAIDTNIVVRLAARDDQAQLAIAQEIVSAQFLLIPSVVLEAVWTLNSVYGFSRNRIAEEIGKIVALETALVVSGEAMEWALERFVQGADFADMLHAILAWSHGATSFVTFDREVAKSVSDAQIQIETLGIVR